MQALRPGGALEYGADALDRQTGHRRREARELEVPGHAQDEVQRGGSCRAGSAGTSRRSGAREADRRCILATRAGVANGGDPSSPAAIWSSARDTVRPRRANWAGRSSALASASGAIMSQQREGGTR